jgi:hypothetical protein
MNVVNLAPIPLAATWVLPFTAVRKDGVTPMDLTGAWVGFTVAYSATEAPAFQLTTLTGGVVLTNPTQGGGEVRATPLNTAGAARGGPAVYSLIVKEPDGTVIPVAAGVVQLVDYPGRAP